MDKQKIYQTLEEIFEYYKLVKQKYNYSLADSSFQLFGDIYKYQAEELIKLELFSKTLKLASYDKFPEIVDDKTYKNLPVSSFEYLGITINLPELFRGVRNLDHHANLLCDKQYHYGVGDSCSGLHTAIHFDTALQYTNKDQSRILKLKLKNANIIDDLSITTEFAQVIINKTISDPKHSEFLNIFTTFVNNIQSETLRKEF